MVTNIGRGATHNKTSSRFGLPEREADGDWLDDQRLIDGEPPRLKTSVTLLKPKTIISYNKSPDIGFDRSINPFAGCEHHHGSCVVGGRSGNHWWRLRIC